MNLDETQLKMVRQWIADGLKLSDIQKRLEVEFGTRMTYLDVRLLVDDLKLVPKDHAPAAPQTLGPAAVREAKLPGLPPATLAKNATTVPTTPTGRVSVNVDTVARPGALVSGSVAFSDGNRATWHLDQLGRLGLMPEQAGYRPSPEDLQTFQAELQSELQRIGF